MKQLYITVTRARTRFGYTHLLALVEADGRKEAIARGAGKVKKEFRKVSIKHVAALTADELAERVIGPC